MLGFVAGWVRCLGFSCAWRFHVLDIACRCQAEQMQQV